MGLCRLGYRCVVLSAGLEPAFAPYHRAVLPDERGERWCPGEELNPDRPLTKRLHHRNASGARGTRGARACRWGCRSPKFDGPTSPEIICKNWTAFRFAPSEEARDGETRTPSNSGRSRCQTARCPHGIMRHAIPHAPLTARDRAPAAMRGNDDLVWCLSYRTMRSLLPLRRRGWPAASYSGLLLCRCSDRLANSVGLTRIAHTAQPYERSDDRPEGAPCMARYGRFKIIEFLTKFEGVVAATSQNKKQAQFSAALQFSGVAAITNEPSRRIAGHMGRGD